MERTEIIKALECCTKAETWGDCEEMGCPAHTKQGCHYYLRTDDDYENTIYIELCKDALSLIKELTEENERLAKHNAVLIEDNHILATEFKKITIADTVRKMQERLDKHFCHDPAFLGVEQRLIMDVIDQIAKEMVEGEK